MNPIASISICNTASLNIYDIAHGINDLALCGFNDEEPEWRNIINQNPFDESQEENGVWIDFGETFYNIEEALRA